MARACPHSQPCHVQRYIPEQHRTRRFGAGAAAENVAVAVLLRGCAACEFTLFLLSLPAITKVVWHPSS